MNTKWNGFLDKWNHIKPYISKLHPNDVVCYTDTFDVTYNGIGELNISEFNIYPNPTNSELTIELPENKFFTVKLIPSGTLPVLLV